MAEICSGLLLFVVLMFCQDCHAQEAPFAQSILEYSQNYLPHEGILKNREGFVYLEVDNRYIRELISFIEDEGFEEAPYFGSPSLVGAHISVIYPDEVKKYEINEIQECGQIIPFTLKECKVVQPPNWKEIEEVYFITVESPQLELFREKYGLPKREYEFHITIGVKFKRMKAS